MKEESGGLLLLRRITPLPRRNAVYFCSGAYTLTAVSRKSEIAAAIRYALGRWRALLRYCEDGHIEIHNNAAERALRAVALGERYLNPILSVGVGRGKLLE